MRISLSLRNDHAELTRLVALAERFTRHHALPPVERARLSIILEELFTNVVAHGYGERALSGQIEVALAYNTGRLTIEFNDDGRPFDPLKDPAPDLDRPAPKRRIGGLGLHIVRSLVDSARYVREGGRNHLVLTRDIASFDRNDENC